MKINLSGGLGLSSIFLKSISLFLKNINLVKNTDHFYCTIWRWRWSKEIGTLFGKEQPWGYLGTKIRLKKKIIKEKDYIGAALHNYWIISNGKVDIIPIYNCDSKIPSNILRTTDYITLNGNKLAKYTSKLGRDFLSNSIFEPDPDKEFLALARKNFILKFNFAEPKDLMLHISQKTPQPRIDSMIWKLFTGKIKQGSQLRHITQSPNFNCRWCSMEIDNLKHRYFTCNIIRKEWTKITKKIYGTTPNTHDLLFFENLQGSKFARNLTFKSIVWAIHNFYYSIAYKKKGFSIHSLRQHIENTIIENIETIIKKTPNTELLRIKLKLSAQDLIHTPAF